MLRAIETTPVSPEEYPHVAEWRKTLLSYSEKERNRYYISINHLNSKMHILILEAEIFCLSCAKYIKKLTNNRLLVHVCYIVITAGTAYPVGVYVAAHHAASLPPFHRTSTPAHPGPSPHPTHHTHPWMMRTPKMSVQTSWPALCHIDIVWMLHTLSNS